MTLCRSRDPNGFPYRDAVATLNNCLPSVSKNVGSFDEAIAVMSGEAKNTNYIGPSARLVTAMALYRKGNTKDARAALAAAVDSYDWSPAKADNRDVWIPHILRREAEALILADRRGILGGRHHPWATTSDSLWWRSIGLLAAAFAGDRNWPQT